MIWRAQLLAANAAIAYRDALFLRFFYEKASRDAVKGHHFLPSARKGKQRGVTLLPTLDANAAITVRRLRCTLPLHASRTWRLLS